MPDGYNSMLNTENSKISSSISDFQIGNIVDQNIETSLSLSQKDSTVIDFNAINNYTVRSIIIIPVRKAMYAEVDFQVKNGERYHSVKKIIIDRSNTRIITGFNPYAPVVVAVPNITAKHFRVVFNKASANAGIAELKLSSSAEVERYAEKTLSKMHPTPLPYWNEYQWPEQPSVDNKQLLINPSEVRDITAMMQADGRLVWDAPKGKWIIMRVGMRPTGVVNEPASPEGTGLEVDKMSKEHVNVHFDAFLGEIMKRIPQEDRKSWKVVVADSYEKGGQNWTDDFLQKFKAKYGYEALPFFPVFNGKVIGSRDQSDRFLWDLRRFVADNIAYEYVGGLREAAHKNGLTTWLENYGHWGFSGEFLQYGGQSDEVAGEFWSEGELGDIENRAASSAAHIYGKTKVSAESFTAGGKAYSRYPLLMKQRGDRFFTEGINNTLLHVYIQQPNNLKPGINASFGNEFNRHNTWFYDADLFIQYLKRCNLMLQQGKYVADVAYFIGEDAQKMTGIRDPELPAGYSFDYINAEVIEKRLSVKDGKLVLPDGMSYSILVLPKLETMRPELLRKIKDLVSQGAVILGPAPKRSPSLENYPFADKEVKKLASELWGFSNKKVREFGAGKFLTDMDMQTAFDFLKIVPDYKVSTTDSTLFIHRTLSEGEIYFVSNQSHKEIAFNPEFRVSGKRPELWDAVNGSIRDLTSWSDDGKVSMVPLKLAPLQSIFVVFRKKTSAPSALNISHNFPQKKTIETIRKPWQVTFDPDSRGPEKPVVFDNSMDWAQRPEESIKYYSGTAYYKNSFLGTIPKKGEHLILDLGNVIAVAKVKINGKDVGGVWTYPYQIDITDAVKKGENRVEVKVVNTWVNRLIGDARLPENERKTFTSINTYNAKSPLQPSGLLGPISIKSVNYSE
jgi:hypothetical protein